MSIVWIGSLSGWSGTTIYTFWTTAGMNLSAPRFMRIFGGWPDLAAKNQTVVVAGTDPRRFTDEILSVHVDDPQFSYQSVNGQAGDDLLPALMITTIHPNKFKETNPGYRFSQNRPAQADDKLILLPLRGVCQNATEVIVLIERIFWDIAAKKPLREFSVAREIRAGQRGAYSDALILKPALWGVGIDLKELVKTWKQKRT